MVESGEIVGRKPKTKLERALSGGRIAPFDLVTCLKRNADLRIQRESDLESWEVGFAQILLKERDYAIPQVLGYEYMPGHWEKYPNLATASVALVHARNAHIDQVERAIKKGEPIHATIEFLKPILTDPERVRDFFGLGYYTIQKSCAEVYPALSLKDYYCTVRSSLLRTVEEPEVSVGSIGLMLNNVLEDTVFSEVGLEKTKR